MKLVVKRDPGNGNWGIYAGKTLVEGGFFSRDAAEYSKENLEREALDDEVAKAERKAGWDPNP